MARGPWIHVVNGESIMRIVRVLVVPVVVVLVLAYGGTVAYLLGPFRPQSRAHVAGWPLLVRRGGAPGVALLRSPQAM